MIAATLSQLILLEQITVETGLRGEEASKELERRWNRPTAPLYAHRPDRFLRYYREVYNETFERHGMENAPPFATWMSEAELELCGLARTHTNELVPLK